MVQVYAVSIPPGDNYKISTLVMLHGLKTVTVVSHVAHVDGASTKHLYVLIT